MKIDKLLHLTQDIARRVVVELLSNLQLASVLSLGLYLVVYVMMIWVNVIVRSPHLDVLARSASEVITAFPVHGMRLVGFIVMLFPTSS